MADGFNFSDWFGDKKKEYHRMTIPEHTTMMEEIGLHSFNSGTLYDILKRDKNICVSGDQAVFDPASGIAYDDDFALKTYNQILDTHPHVDLAHIVFWDNGQILKPITGYVSGVHRDHHVLGALQSHHEFVTMPSGGNNPSDQWSERKSFSQDAQTSLGGSGIIWEVPLCFQFGTSGVDGAQCIKCDWITFNARLYDFDHMTQEKRVTALVGDGVHGPLIAAAPTTTYGKPGVPDIGLGPGVYADPVAGHPHSLVAAPLSMHFNQNTGLFESGARQMIAALLTDVEGIEVKSVDSANINIEKQDELCEKTGSRLYQGAFNLGRALPMGVKGSNPNIFGPDLTRTHCEVHEEKEMIVVVNRSAKSFSSGDRVLLSYIDGEWIIIQSLSDRDDDGIALMTGKWGPTHYMMAPAEILANSQHPHNREQDFHKRFYFELGWTESGRAVNVFPELNDWDKLAKGTYKVEDSRVDASGGIRDNDGNPIPPFVKVIYNQGINGGDDISVDFDDMYWQHTSFDMMNDNLGGVNDWNYLATTHPHRGAGGKAHNEQTKIDANFPFHGINMVDGYTTTSMSRVKLYSEKDLLHTKAVELAGSGWYLQSKDKARPFDNSRTADNLASGSPARNVNREYAMFGVRDATNQVPADIAMNAPPNGVNGFPIESLGYLKECFPTVSSGPAPSSTPTLTHEYPSDGGLIKGLRKYLGSGISHPIHQERYSWMEYEIEGFNSRYPLYDWKPLNNRRISFTPLPAELFTHYDYPNPVYKGMGDFQGLEDPYNTFILPAGPPVGNPIPAFPDMIYPGPYNHSDKHLDILGPKFFVRETDGGLGFGHGKPLYQQPGNGKSGYTTPPFSFKCRRPQYDHDNVNSWVITAGSKVPRYNGTVLADPPAVDTVVEVYRCLPFSAMFTEPGYNPSTGNTGVNYYNTWMKNYWNEHLQVGFNDWGSGVYATNGANAVGIITTKVRMTTSAKNFSFAFEQLLGVDGFSDTSRSDAGVFGGFLANLFGGGNFFGGTVNGDLIGQWGKATGYDEWNSPNTSACYVRIVDAWPDEQTIFDPRTFSVHHFHAGELGSLPFSAWYSGGLPLKAGGELIYDDGTGSAIDVLPDEMSPYKYKYSNILFSDGIYLVDIRHFDTDFRVPTYVGTEDDHWEDNGVGDFVPEGTLVDTNSPLRKKLDWRVNTVKRGMCQPFNYFHRTIGVGTISVSKGGEGYMAGDLLVSQGGTGGGCYVKVTEVNSTGGIKKVAILEDMVDGLSGAAAEQPLYGIAFSHDDFIPSGVCIDIDPRTGIPSNKTDCELVDGKWSGGYPDSKVRFVKYAAGANEDIDKFLPSHAMEGTGAELWASQGIVYDFYNPEKGLNTTRPLTHISLPSQEGQKPSTNGRADGGFQVFSDVTDPSPDFAYDLFFHFHSDISYVNKGPNSYAQSYLQYLDIDIGVAEPRKEARKFSWLELLMRRLFPELDAPGAFGNPPDYKSGSLVSGK